MRAARFLVGLLVVGSLGVAACAGSSAQSKADGDESSSRSETDDEGGTAGASRRLPDPSEASPNSEEESTSGDERRRCSIERRDWTDLDYRETPKLHQMLKENSDVFEACLAPLSEKSSGVGREYVLVFDIRGGDVVDVAPSPMSQVLTRRLDPDERDALDSCLEEARKEFDFPTLQEGSFEVVHPFCIPRE